MLIQPTEIIDGAVATLRDRVLPEVGSRVARSQLYAVIDLLRNLRDAVEPRRDLIDAEIEGLEAVLERGLSILAEAGHAEVAGRMREARAAAPEAPPGERVAALRAALVEALDVAYSLPHGAGEALRAALAGHLAAQAVRDVSTVKPSMLEEISRG